MINKVRPNFYMGIPTWNLHSLKPTRVDSMGVARY